MWASPAGSWWLYRDTRVGVNTWRVDPGHPHASPPAGLSMAETRFRNAESTEQGSGLLLSSAVDPHLGVLIELGGSSVRMMNVQGHLCSNSSVDRGLGHIVSFLGCVSSLFWPVAR